MSTFNFSCPVEVRYGDLDPQGHMNNAKFISYMEQGRFRYIEHIGLWRVADGFEKLGQIVASVTCDYKRPVLLGQVVDVAVRVVHLGTKSLEFDYRLTVEGVEVALGRSVQVAYDYGAGTSIPVPAHWRELVSRFEGWTE